MKEKLLKFFRNTLKEGFRDAFELILGHHGYVESHHRHDYAPPAPLHYGVLDLLIFPLLARKMIRWGDPYQTQTLESVHADGCIKPTKMGMIVSGIGWGLQIPRFFLAAFVWLVSTPLVVAVHCLKYPVVNFYQNKFYKIIGSTGSFLDDVKASKGGKRHISLGEYVDSTESSLNNLSVLVSEKPKKNTEKDIQDSMEVLPNKIDSDSEKNKHYCGGTTYYRETFFVPTSATKEQIEAGRALGLF